MAKFDKKLASILVSCELVNETQCVDLLEKTVTDNKSLTELLVADNILTELQIIEAVSDEMNIPPINLDRLTVSEDLLETLSEEMASYYDVLPVASIGDMLTVAISNPYDILTLDDLKIVTGCDIHPVISTDTAIARNILRCYRGEESSFDVDELFGDIAAPELELQKEEDLDEEVDIAAAIQEGNDAPVVKLVNLILFQAISDHISDIHIEAFEKRTRVRYRLDGACFESMSPPRKMHASIVSRIKVMCGMDIAERRRPQDAKFQLKVQGRQVDFRVSVLPCVHGEKVVIRILDSSNLSLALDSLGFEEQCLEQFSNAIKQPYGMILVTGPTGSGKSTTLYSSIREVMCVEENITTVEDPVEYQLEGVNQVQVSEKRGLTFAGALRSILRQDPDTVMIGEIRDLETVEIAVKAALTGHRVFSTLHTNDAPSTITRMIDMGIDPFMVASSVLLVAAQRLARKICDDCKKPIEVSNDMLKLEGFTDEEIASSPVIYQSVGCEKCGQKGYKGRFALLETMPLTDNIRRIIIDGGSALDIRKEALAEGMITLRRAGLNNVMRGKTTIEEILRITLRD
ncbi:MAG: GspE/PulE family protein [Planctomycetota bacterium]|jgi:type IV pilus assembly protein PilB